MEYRLGQVSEQDAELHYRPYLPIGNASVCSKGLYKN
jgi:hypothetical protein